MLSIIYVHVNLLSSRICCVLQAFQVQNHLLNIQPEYKADLLEKVTIYQKDQGEFVSDYTERYLRTLDLILFLLLFLINATFRLISDWFF